MLSPSVNKKSCLLSQRSWVRYPVWPHTCVSPSADSRGAVVSYWQKYVHEVLVNCLGGLSLPRKSVVRLTDHPDMTLDVYRGCKTTTKKAVAFETLLLNHKIKLVYLRSCSNNWQKKSLQQIKSTKPCISMP